MADKVNVELLAKAYCEVLTRNTGIQHYYTIKKKESNSAHDTSRTANFPDLQERMQNVKQNRLL